MEFLIRGLARPKRDDRVLELFAGSCLGTVLIAQQLQRPELLVAIDLHYSYKEEVKWRYDAAHNYQRLAGYYGVKTTPLPILLGMDAMKLPFPKQQFNMVVAADSPRSSRYRFGDSEKTDGDECGLTPAQQKEVFVESAHEAHRVLRSGGLFVATAPESWTKDLPFSQISLKRGPARRLQFAECDDPIRYLVAEK